MGASGWSYFTPYKSNVNQALQELRQRVFTNREYEQPQSMDNGMEAFMAQFPPEVREKKRKELRVVETMSQVIQKMRLQPLSPAVQQQYLMLAMQLTQGKLSATEYEARLAEFNALAAKILGEKDKKPKPASIEALLEQCAENGTHTILDIDHIADEPEFGAAAPMPKETLLEVFGTLEPTRGQVLEAEIGEDLERWQAWYIVVYHNGRPTEIFFTGCSGD